MSRSSKYPIDVGAFIAFAGKWAVIQPSFAPSATL